MDLWVAFLLGLGGSVHCVGMCGPLVVTLPVISTDVLGVVLCRILYNLGRIMVYGIIGAFLGSVGEVFGFERMRQGVSLLLGTALFATGIVRLLFGHYISIPIWRISSWNMYRESMKYLLCKRQWSTQFLLGMLNGLLPCGLVYLGLVAAIAEGSALRGGLLMLVLGVGTIPAMLLTDYVGRLIGQKVSRWGLGPIGMMLVGGLLVCRSVGEVSLMGPDSHNHGIHEVNDH